MSVTSATIPNDGSSYVYGGILFRRIAEEDPAPQRAGLATCLSQGLTTGAVLMFVFTMAILLYDNQNGYNFLVVGYFPLIICYGLVPGFIEGLVLWICTRVAGHNLQWYARLFIAGLVFAIPQAVVLLVFYGAYDHSSDAALVFFVTIPIACAIGASFGFLTGSRFSPWRQLVRGDTSLPAGSSFAAGLTGFVLRLAVVFFFMEAVLSFVVIMQVESWRSDLMWSSAILLHFIVALAIVFARLNIRLLVPVALVTNIPIALFLNLLITEGQEFMVYLCIGYLAAWASFLIIRYRPTYHVIHFMKEEINYYLLD